MSIWFSFRRSCTNSSDRRPCGVTTACIPARSSTCAEAIPSPCGGETACLPHTSYRLIRQSTGRSPPYHKSAPWCTCMVPSLCRIVTGIRKHGLRRISRNPGPTIVPKFTIIPMTSRPPPSGITITLGITRLNLYAGLTGMYFIRDEVEDNLNLPKGPYEIPLIIQDRYFNLDGSLFYPTQTPGDPDPRVPLIWLPEFFGDTVLVNGKVWPFLEVEPRKYRFRILNASNARFYHLTLNESTEQGVSVGRPGPAVFQIGTDGGLLPSPVRLTDFVISPAERFDVVIDFAGLDG